MALTQWLEIIIIALAMLIIPFILWIVHQLRQSILNHVNLIVNEYYNGLEDQIKDNRNELAKLKTRLKHRAEIASLKYNALADKIDEVENFLEKTTANNNTNYHRRNRLKAINPAELDKSTQYDDDDDDLSMAF